MTLEKKKRHRKINRNKISRARGGGKEKAGCSWESPRAGAPVDELGEDTPGNR